MCQALRRENGFAKGEVKARGVVLHEEGKETQFTAVFKGLGVKISVLEIILVRYWEMSVLEMDLEMDCGVKVTSKTNHKYLAQSHKLIDNPTQYHLFQEGLFGSPHQLLCWWATAETPRVKGDNFSAKCFPPLNSSCKVLLKFRTTESQIREGFRTTA